MEIQDVRDLHVDLQDVGDPCTDPEDLHVDLQDIGDLCMDLEDFRDLRDPKHPNDPYMNL